MNHDYEHATNMKENQRKRQSFERFIDGLKEQGVYITAIKRPSMIDLVRKKG